MMNKQHKEILLKLKALMKEHDFSFSVGGHHELNILVWDNEKRKYSETNGDIRSIEGLEYYIQEEESCES